MRSWLILVVLVGCDGESGGHHASTGTTRTPVEIACDHFQYGPGVEATALTEGNLPIVEPHTRTDTRLDTEGGRLGFEPRQAGKVYLLLDKEVPLTVLDGAGAEQVGIPVEIEGCDRAAVGFEYDLQNETYVLVLGPSPETEVALVAHVPPAGGHHGSHGTVEVPAEYVDLVNPLSDDPETLAAGGALYAQLCASCHGDTGRGDGPTARSQTPAPTDLTDDDASDTDGYLFWRLTEGRSAAENPSTMPAFSDLTTEEERWQLILFLRTLSGS